MKNAFFNFISDYPNINILFQDLLSKGNVFLIGGIVRDFIETKKIIKPRDIDIIVDLDEDILNKTISMYKHEKNRFRGYKLYIDSIEVDIWAITETWAFKEEKLDSDTANISDTVFLNVDSVVYDFKNNTFHRKRYNEFIETKTLDIVLRENPCLELNLLRALVFMDRYKAKLSESIISLFLNKFNEHQGILANKLFELQSSHYKENIYTKEQLEYKINKILAKA